METATKVNKMILQFKAKVTDGQIMPSFDMVKVVDAPKTWKRSHVVDAGKASPYLNSNMLGQAIDRELKKTGIGKRIDVDNPPENISVKFIGPLAQITLKVN